MGTAYTPIGSITIQVAEVHWTPIQTGLRPTVESFFISMENAICVERELLTILTRKDLITVNKTSNAICTMEYRDRLVHKCRECLVLGASLSH